MDAPPITTIDKFCPLRFFSASSATQRAVVAVSACLCGQKVRYDGGDKRIDVHSLLEDELELVPICPEVGAGFGVPRPPVQLVAIDNGIRARGREDPEFDATQPLQSFAAHSLRQLTRGHALCGYLWKSRSPSCGFGSTPLFDRDDTEIGHTNGIQAEYFRRQLPYLNYREDIALQTANNARAFILRCRLVFDFLYATPPSADPVPLQVLHMHYAFLRAKLDTCCAESLSRLNTTNNKKDYLAALLKACDQIPDTILLELFS